MLTRTNLTLSALSNRLNLGTRSLVLNTSVNNGTALRIRHAHQDAMREHMVVYAVGEPVAVAYPAPPITDPAPADCLPLGACDFAASADASLRPFQEPRSWRQRQSAVSGTSWSRSSSSASRKSFASLKAGAAGAASGRSANAAAFIAAAAGS